LATELPAIMSIMPSIFVAIVGDRMGVCRVLFDYA